jgi:hypothetical protein
MSGCSSHQRVRCSVPLLDPSEADQRVTLLVHREREQVLVPEPRGDRGRFGRRVVRRLRIAFDDMLEHRRDDEVPALDAVRVLGLEQPLRAPEPAAGGPDGAVRHEA